eukprot:TRINITY_DN23091_c0_g3_i1.p1 TRINITY_DN23091_c0_g3~~TRINITY_DN23091_c0_g3_i1.p1  ORF type:complete len:874 (+),score=195.42 TRINITY_DN23091_c0_g3_i1:98-2719(+)
MASKQNPRLSHAAGATSYSAVYADDGQSNDQSGAPAANAIRKIRYNEFGVERIAEFDDEHLTKSGIFQSNSSKGHGEYGDRIRAIQLRKQGWGKADIAKDLGRPEKFVAKWWQMEEKQVPRPAGVHQYLTLKMDSEGNRTNRKDLWRDVEIVRSFVSDTQGIYKDIVEATSWNATASETKDFRTASYHLRYDRDGNMKWSSMKNGKYYHGDNAKMDVVVEKLFKKVGISDLNTPLGLYWFSDGDACVGSHRHYFWTARIAFGGERIMTVDKTPVLLREGDLVIIGPQRHGIPPMPDATGGSLRISVPIPMPEEAKQAEQHHHAEGHTRQEADSDWTQEGIEQLVAMGFDSTTAAGALQVYGGSVERAADALLSGNEDLLAAFAIQGGAEWEGEESWGATDHGGWEDGEGYGDEMEWDAEDDQWEAYAAGAERGGGLQEQFEEYEKMLQIDDAEKAWDGYGDLMHNGFRRANLNLDMMGPQTVFSIGTGALSEKQFFDLLARHSITVLYDFRPSDYRDEVHAGSPHFEVRKLKSTARTRGIWYRHVPVGKESAFGMLRHLKSEEVQHILVELVWQAKHRGPTVFVGRELDWRMDNRLVIAEELVSHGHHVSHIDAAGSIEVHNKGVEIPDFIVQEEARLRKVQAKRQAGELQRPTKSAVDRSTEAVARSLAIEKEQVDISAELRDAENQSDLNRLQKKVVRMQMAENKKEVGLSKKNLVQVPGYVLAAAQEEQARLVAKKAQKEQNKASAAAAGKSADVETADDDMTSDPTASSSSAVAPLSTAAPSSASQAPSAGSSSMADVGDAAVVRLGRRGRWGGASSSSGAGYSAESSAAQPVAADAQRVEPTFEKDQAPPVAESRWARRSSAARTTDS